MKNSSNIFEEKKPEEKDQKDVDSQLESKVSSNDKENLSDLDNSSGFSFTLTKNLAETVSYDHDLIFDNDNSFLWKYSFRKNANKVNNIQADVLKNNQKSEHLSNNREWVKRVKITTSKLRFSSFDRRLLLDKKVIIVLIIAITNAFFGSLLMKNTGIYSSGMAAITQGISRLVGAYTNEHIFTLLYWILYLVCNIPLAIFGWYKIGKRFTFLTVIYIAAYSLSGYLISFIPGFDTFFIFGDVQSSITELTEKKIQILLWDSPHDSSKIFIMFIYAAIVSQTSAVCYAILLIINASSGGLDFLSVWYANKKYKKIGLIMMELNLISLVIGVLIGTYTPASIILENSTTNITGTTVSVSSLAWMPGMFFSPNFLVSIFLNLLFTVTLNTCYPRYNLVRVEIFSEKIEEIRNILLTDKHPYTISILKVIGGYSLKEKTIIVTISLFMELPRLISLVRHVDKNSIISTTNIRHFNGYMNIYEDVSEKNSFFKKKNK